MSWITIVVVSIFFLMVVFSSLSLCQSNATIEECKRDFGCVDIPTNILPFCGHPGFNLRCVNKDHVVINIDGIEHRILSVDRESYSFTLVRSDLSINICPKMKRNSSTLDQSSSFAYATKAANLTLAYDCTEFKGRRLKSYPKTFTCPVGAVRNFYFNDTFLDLVSDDIRERCSGGILNVRVDGDILYQIEEGRVGLVEGLNRGFPLNYMNFRLCDRCHTTHGVCGFNTDAQFQCSFPTQGEGHNISQRQRIRHESHGAHTGGQKVKVLIGIIGGGMGILLIIIIFCCCQIIKLPQNFILSLTKKDRDIEAFIRSNGHLTAKRFRFSDVKKMTKSFKDKLGQGGFGEVYKGKLSDNRLVAVKLLNSSKGNGEEFINEVASISRTSHVNIVTLLGFCLEGGKRALIYEFMSNGSLEKFLFSDNTSQTNPNLDWDKLIQIATGIARGLEYLHRGCNTRILHFDIKPHNILLDEDFCPKISDFGLANLFPDNKQSSVSLLDARGTTGYIAPEVFNRNFGVVSSKSDVYSYGMMILEMVSGRKNINPAASRTSEIYFPDWVYKHLEDENKLKIWGDMTSEENEITRKMVLVGLWCIQIAPSDRPSMSKVIQMLEGSLEALQIPPKPTLITPKSIEEE